MTTKSQELKVEFQRQNTTRARMLLAFKREGELNTRELMRFGTGVSSRLYELREDGHRIVRVYEKPGIHRYIYMGNRKDDDKSNVSVID